jgi:signal transduction histidine kinase
LDAQLAGEQINVQVVDRRGRLVARSLALGGRVLPIDVVLRRVIAQGVGRYASLTMDGDHLRVYVAPLAETGGPASGGAVAVAASTRDLAKTLESLHLFVVVAALAAAAAAAAVLAFLMRRALRPLGRLADGAAEIERTGDARRRHPEPASDDEVGALAQTLNRMLASLERARERERRFLADASHELRTPLTGLVGNISYLARHGASKELIADLEHDVARLAALANDLLALSREEAAEVPDEIVRLDELVRTLGENDAHVVAVAPLPVVVRGDRAALERALANLVENAHRHGPPAGRISVEVAGDDGIATLSVSDEGRGLQPYEAARAFERFWRGRPGTPGSGLGLAIVRATAERHGGRAYAEGARFTIELPALRDVSDSPSTTERNESSKGPP